MINKDKFEIHLITGKAQVGKSTFAHRMADDINGIVLEVSKPIKELAKELGWDGSKIGAGRSLLQRIGREGRELSYCVWTNYALYQIFRQHFLFKEKEKKELKSYRYIIPDIRFNDEIMFFKQHFDNVKVYEVVRENWDNNLTREQKNDITERGVSPELIDKVVKV